MTLPAGRVNSLRAPTGAWRLLSDTPIHKEIPVPTIIPEPESRLAQLVGQYDMAKAESEKAAEALKAITDGIKYELTAAAPGETSIEVASPDLAQPLRVVAVTKWLVDGPKLKATDPETYVRYAKQSTSWTLKRVVG